jgi:hypothetical protein
MAVAVAVFQLRVVELRLLLKPQVSYQALEAETVFSTGLQTSQHPQTLLIQLGLEVPEGLVAALMVVALRALAAVALRQLALREVLALAATVVRVCKVQSQAMTCFTLPVVVVA